MKRKHVNEAVEIVEQLINGGVTQEGEPLHLFTIREIVCGVRDYCLRQTDSRPHFVATLGLSLAVSELESLDPNFDEE